MRNEQDQRRSTGIHVGSASIVMIFAVLCLTVFSSLSFVTANHERKLAEKSAAVIQQYYQADWNCEVMYEQIYQHLQKGGAPEQLSALGVQVEQQGALYYVTYTEDINDEEKLLVKLAVQRKAGLKTEQWKVIAAKQWNYDEHIDVWNGE